MGHYEDEKSEQWPAAGAQAGFLQREGLNQKQIFFVQKMFHLGGVLGKMVQLNQIVP